MTAFHTPQNTRLNGKQRAALGILYPKGYHLAATYFATNDLGEREWRHGKHGNRSPMLRRPSRLARRFPSGGWCCAGRGDIFSNPIFSPHVLGCICSDPRHGSPTVAGKKNLKRSRPVDDHERRFKESLARVMLRMRRKAGLSAYAMARFTGVSDQAVRNFERGLCKQGCRTGTLARWACRLDTTVTALVRAAEREMD